MIFYKSHSSRILTYCLIILIWSCTSCPENYEVTTEDSRRVYLRHYSKTDSTISNLNSLPYIEIIGYDGYNVITVEDINDPLQLSFFSDSILWVFNDTITSDTLIMKYRSTFYTGECRGCKSSIEFDSLIITSHTFDSVNITQNHYSYKKINLYFE